MEKLKELLRNGDLDQDTYDEIVKRWENEGGSSSTDEGTGEERTPGRERSKKVHVSGSGRMSDVYTHEFSGSGSVHVDGYLDADTVDISGSGHIDGDLISSDSVDISGAATVKGKVDASSIETSGSMKASEIKCRDIESSGSLKVEKGIEAGTMDISGGVQAENIIAEVIKASGGIRAESIKAQEIYASGRVRAKSVESKRFEMEIYGTSSRINKLDSEIVEVKQGRRIFSGSAEIVELNCKRGHLEGVIARKVVGDELIIGNGCDIDYVEGRNIRILEGARVREKKQI